MTLLLPACRDTQATPIDRSSYAVLFEARDLQLLTAIDRIEDEGARAAAPWLLWIQRNETRNLPERSRAAATLCRFGFDEGQAFCLAILGAWLPGHEAECRRFGIPHVERMAFAREIAIAALQDRAQEAGQSCPPYDVNQGVPQMTRSVQAWKERIASLPSQARPPAGFRALYPRIAPPGWPGTHEQWSRLRSDLRDGYDPASAGTESSPGRGTRR